MKSDKLSGEEGNKRNFPDPAKLEPFPWHREIIERCSSQLADNALPHALILAGPVHMGKGRIAINLAANFLCQDAHRGKRCNKCRGCVLVASGFHPDCIYITAGSDNKDIRIDQIRAMREQVYQSAQQGGNKVCIISPAEKMNANSANALLKVLEEPPENTYFLLVTHGTLALLPTIASRCQRLKPPLPGRDQLGNWLEKEFGNCGIEAALENCSGLPEKAIAILQSEHKPGQYFPMFLGIVRDGKSVVGLLSQLDSDEYDEFVDECMKLTHTSLTRRLAGTGGDMNGMALDWPPAILFRIQEILLTLKRQFGQNTNKRLVLEAGLVECQGLSPALDRQILAK